MQYNTTINYITTTITTVLVVAHTAILSRIKNEYSNIHDFNHCYYNYTQQHNHTHQHYKLSLLFPLTYRYIYISISTSSMHT